MRISKKEYYLNIAYEVCKRSTCLKRHYGAIIVLNDEIKATGYNGSPRGEINCCDIHIKCPRKNIKHNSGDYSDCPAVHAEQNAIISAGRKNTLNATLYLAGEEMIDDKWTRMEKCIPCPICERIIKNAGITDVIGNL